MREAWTGELVGRMHNAEVTKPQLAAEMNCSVAYVNMCLSGSRTPKGGRERMEAAFENILRKRQEAG